MTVNPKIEELRLKRAQSHAGGGGTHQKAERKGRHTAHERLDILLDPGSFRELDAFVTTAPPNSAWRSEEVSGRQRGYRMGNHQRTVGLCFFAGFHGDRWQFERGPRPKIIKVMEMALKTGAPVIGLNDSGGARIQEGVGSLGGYAEIFLHNTMSSGVMPQISVIMGPCAGGAVYSPALTDFIIMVKDTSYMYITGPDVVKSVTHEDVTHEELGGASVHASKSGVCHMVADNETQALLLARELMSYLPQNNMEDPPFVATTDDPLRADPELDTIIPDNPNKPYDMKEVIKKSGG